MNLAQYTMISAPGSGSSARKSVALDTEVVKLGEAILATTGYDGPAMVEFKKELHGPRHVLMEINGRPWGSIQLAIHCGVDFPRHVVDWYLENRLPPKRVMYSEGITSRDLASDLTHLGSVWHGQPPGWPVRYPNFLVSLLKVSLPWYPGLRYDDLFLRDPRPGLAGVSRWFWQHLGRHK